MKGGVEKSPGHRARPAPPGFPGSKSSVPRTGPMVARTIAQQDMIAVIFPELMAFLFSLEGWFRPSWTPCSMRQRRLSKF